MSAPLLPPVMTAEIACLGTPGLEQCIAVHISLGRSGSERQQLIRFGERKPCWAAAASIAWRRLENARSTL